MKTSTLLLASAFACVGLAGCNCGPKTVDRFPQLELPGPEGTGKRTSLDFLKVQVNVTSVRKIQLRNAGTLGLTITKATADAPFGVDSTLPIEIAAGQTVDLPVTFTPTEADQPVTGTLTITSTDPAREIATVALAGLGISAVARVVPSPVDFGEVYIGESKRVTVTLSNDGTDELVVKGAAFTAGSSATVSGDLSRFKITLSPGTSVNTELTYAPTADETLTGKAGFELVIDPMQGGSITVPIKGRSTFALPEMCFKRDDTGLEVCANSNNNSVSIMGGAFCDNSLFSCGVDGGFSGKFYVKNVGNFPVSYALSWNGLPPSARCDGGSSGSDFTFSNGALLADGGREAKFVDPIVKLPINVSAAKPWETTPVTVAYRASSRCFDEGADQAQILWSRRPQTDAGESASSARMPQTLFLNINASSKLPHPSPSGTNCGTAGTPASFPCEVPFYGLNNGGDAPLKITKVELWKEFTNLGDGGGPTGGIFQICDPMNPSGDCAAFTWKDADGGNPNQYAPHTVPATTNPNVPTQVQIGRLVFGAACLDGGLTSCPNTPFKVYAVISTDDPYTPTVIAPVSGIGQ